MPWDLNGNNLGGTLTEWLGTRDANPLIIGTQTGGPGLPTATTEAMRITAAAQGRGVCIGTTTPRAKLTVAGGDRTGVHGISDDSYGVKGEASADDVAGVLGESTSGDGFGVQGTNTSNGTGVFGECARGAGVGGRSESGIGVNGISESNIGTNGSSTSGFGVNAFSNPNIGVSSISNGTGDRGIGMDDFTRNGTVGVRGISLTSTGVLGTGPFSGVRGTSNSDVGTGVSGVSSGGPGVSGFSPSGAGVRGISVFPSTTSSSGVGVFGSGREAGVMGESGIHGVHGKGVGVGRGVFAEAELIEALRAQGRGASP